MSRVLNMIPLNKLLYLKKCHHHEVKVVPIPWNESRYLLAKSMYANPNNFVKLESILNKLKERHSKSRNKLQQLQQMQLSKTIQ